MTDVDSPAGFTEPASERCVVEVPVEVALIQLRGPNAKQRVLEAVPGISLRQMAGLPTSPGLPEASFEQDVAFSELERCRLVRVEVHLLHVSRCRCRRQVTFADRR